MKFLHSVLAVAAVAVSFGTCAVLWYKAKQEEQPLPKQKQKLYTYLIRSSYIGSCLRDFFFVEYNNHREREKENYTFPRFLPKYQASYVKFHQKVSCSN